MRVEVNADRLEIAPDALAALVEAHEQRAFAAPAGAFGEQPRESGLRGAGCAGDQRAAATEQATAQHLIESCEARRNPLGRGFLRNVGGSGRRHRHAVRTEAQREFARRESRAAILRDLEPAHRNSLLHAAIEPHDAVDHELHETVVGRVGTHAFAVDLRRDDGGQLASRQPVAQAVDFAHLGARRAQQRQQDVDSVEHHPLRADFELFCLEHGQHAAEIEVAARHEGRRELRVHEEQPLCAPGRAGPSRKPRHWRRSRRCFLRTRRRFPACLRLRAAPTRVCSANTLLPVPGPPMTSVVRLSRQSAEADFVEPFDARGDFRQNPSGAPLCCHQRCSCPMQVGCAQQRSASVR